MEGMLQQVLVFVGFLKATINYMLIFFGIFTRPTYTIFAEFEVGIEELLFKI